MLRSNLRLGHLQFCNPNGFCSENGVRGRPRTPLSETAILPKKPPFGRAKAFQKESQKDNTLEVNTPAYTGCCPKNEPEMR